MSQLVTFYPNRITIIPEPRPKKLIDCIDSVFNKLYGNGGNDNISKSSIDNLKKKRNNLTLSKASKKKILDSINSMYCLSKPRKVQYKKNKFIYNYRCSFITLTLPSPQEHSDKKIKKECLNQFLVELRKYYKIKNYVWKAELQNNGNIHFHIVVDKYVNYLALRWRWNRIVNKLGYVKKYSEKMSKLSLSDYAILRKKKIEEIKEAYGKGCRCHWTNPNSVDVMSVRNDDDLAIYLAKYLTKKASKEDNNNDLSLKLRSESFGNIWGRSSSLSKLKYINRMPLELIKKGIERIKKLKVVSNYKGDYFEVLSYRLSTLPKKLSDYITSLIIENAKLYHYPFTVPI